MAIRFQHRLAQMRVRNLLAVFLDPFRESGDRLICQPLEEIVRRAEGVRGAAKIFSGRVGDVVELHWVHASGFQLARCLDKVGNVAYFEILQARCNPLASQNQAGVYPRGEHSCAVEKV